MFKFGRAFSIGAIFSFGFSTLVIASPVQFTDRMTFQDASGPLTTESLDEFTTGGNQIVQPTGVTITGGGIFGSFDREFDGEFITEGTSSLQGSGFIVGSTIEFAFSEPIVSFGIDFLDNTGPFNIDLFVNGATINFSANTPIQTTIDNGPLFIGVRDLASAFTTVLLQTNEDNFAVNFDFLQFETASVFDATQPTSEVPLPASIWSFVLGLLILRGRKVARA